MEQKINAHSVQTSSATLHAVLAEEGANVQEKAPVLPDSSATPLGIADPVVEPPSLLEFPCHFPIKVLGATVDGFIEDMVSTVHQLDPTFGAASLEQRASRTGRYTGLTCTVYAQSKAHLDAIYRALSAHPRVAYIL